MAVNPSVGEWYWDDELRQAFRLLEIGTETVLVVDLHDNRRIVNRMLFERDMKLIPAG